jgi:hypothetical protein
MTHQAPPAAAPAGADPGRQVAQLREVLGLVERIADHEASSDASDARLDEAAWVSGAYDQALPVIQRRFDALAAETAGWAAVGGEALLAAGDAAPPKVAAARLALQLERALSDLTNLIR